MLHAGAAGGTQAQTLHARTGAGVLVLHARRGERGGVRVLHAVGVLALHAGREGS